MKQLLIVNSNKALNASGATPYDLSGLQDGAITFFELGGSSALAAAPTKNFGVALGRPNGQRAFVIPEIDLKTLTIVKALPKLGSAIKRKFTFPTPIVGEEYTVLFIKKGVVPHERNTWHCSVVAKTAVAATEAGNLKTAIEDKLGNYFTVTVSTADVTINGKNVGEQWEIKLIDGLYGVDFSGSTDFVDPEPSIGDKKYIQNLASQCAAGKGFEHTASEGREFIPGYPENVEDFVLDNNGDNGTSTTGYAVYTLRFAVGRDSAKTRDEKVWQLVHIAVPLSNSSFSTIDTILTEPTNSGGSSEGGYEPSKADTDAIVSDLQTLGVDITGMTQDEIEDLVIYLVENGYEPGNTYLPDLWDFLSKSKDYKHLIDRINRPKG